MEQAVRYKEKDCSLTSVSREREVGLTRKKRNNNSYLEMRNGG